MSFDQDQLTEREQFPCDKCKNGNVELNKGTGFWECDSCDFAATAQEDMPDINHPDR